jgi:uncharacterized membrane protein
MTQTRATRERLAALSDGVFTLLIMILGLDLNPHLRTAEINFNT